MTLVYSQVIKDNQKNSFTRLDPFGVGLNWFDLQILGAVGFEKSNQESLFWASSLYKWSSLGCWEDKEQTQLQSHSHPSST